MNMKQKRSLKQRIGAILIPKLPVTRENFDRMRFELNAMKVNLNNRINPFAISKIRQFKNKTDLSVNIGAGPFGKSGWVNIDMFRYDNISLIYDGRKKLPFSNDSVVRIRAEHVFEHLDREDEAPKFLEECVRCLKPGGTLRIIVPDLQLFVNAYYLNTPEAWKAIGFEVGTPSAGFETAMEILNHTFRQNGEHKYGYDFETLHLTAKKAGFSSVTKMQWRKSVDPQLEDDLENHRPYSLYVDCVK
jgi:predicted SAM-dependent methyltransferase